MNKLSSRDRKLVTLALDAGRALEASLSTREETTDADAFRRALGDCSDAESELVKKLALLAPKVSLEHGPKHVMALLVPIERIAGRAARDEEFLYFERDKTAAEARSALKPSTNTSKQEKNLIVICENIRSAFNVGAIFRTTEAFGEKYVWLTGYTPEPQKTAMGTDAIIECRKFDRAIGAIAEARSLGASIVGLETSENAVPIDQFVWPKKTALIVGNERFGLDSETLAACDHIVRIETRGAKNSLNVGVAFGIAAASWSAAQSTEAPVTASKDHVENFSRAVSPIGFVRGGFQNPQVAPRQGAYHGAPKPGSDSNSRATIELESRFEGRPSNFEQALKDLEGFERAWLLFGFHESAGWKPQVSPPRGDGTKRGLFATRAPHRPNGLGLSSVRILSVDLGQRRIEIAEHDLLAGTPIYDIKPYVPEADAFPEAKAGWVDEIENAAHSISESPRAKEILDWLSHQGEKRLRDFIHEQLRFQPLNDERKRIEIRGSGDTLKLGPHHTISFRTWRIDFQLSPGAVNILDLRSGYTDEELNSEAVQDTYGDLKLHRQFKARN